MAEVVTQDENPTRRKTLQERLTTLIESNMRNANLNQQATNLKATKKTLIHMLRLKRTKNHEKAELIPNFRNHNSLKAHFD